ncbi:cytochrome P450 [Nocardia gipuzkoensis]
MWPTIARAATDPDLKQRTEVLALLVRAKYDDGAPLSDEHIADELLTLLAAGHETTATTLAWVIEAALPRTPDPHPWMRWQPAWQVGVHGTGIPGSACACGLGGSRHLPAFQPFGRAAIHPARCPELNAHARQCQFSKGGETLSSTRCRTRPSSRLASEQSVDQTTKIE